jgi:hypothetical protein
MQNTLAIRYCIRTTLNDPTCCGVAAMIREPTKLKDTRKLDMFQNEPVTWLKRFGRVIVCTALFEMIPAGIRLQFYVLCPAKIQSESQY